MREKVLVIGTLDTKGEEFKFLKEEIVARDLDVIIMDAGVLGKPFFKPDIPRETLAKAGGASIEMLSKRDRCKSMEVMMKGVANLTRELYSKGKIAGIMGMGGGSGTGLACAAMKVVPIGFPKLVISTMACGDTSPFVGEKDITMMYSVTDILGLNKISRLILSNGAAAITGMVKNKRVREKVIEKPVIGATMMGVTTDCVSKAKKIIERSGFDMITFHAIGSGGRSLESIIEDGMVKGVLDVTTTEIMNTIVGGVFPCKPNRLETAGKMGIPQVVSCGAIDFVNFWTGSIPEKYKNRKFHQFSPMAVLMRTTNEENIEAAKVISEKLNKAIGPTAFFIPLKGFSSVDAKGKDFFDPEADKAFIDTLEANISPRVKLFKCDNNINDLEFSSKMASTLIEMIKSLNC